MATIEAWKGMYSILVVFLLTVVAAGMWHGGRVWFRNNKGPSWLRESVDQKRGVWLVLILLPIFALVSMGAFAVLCTVID